MSNHITAVREEVAKINSLSERVPYWKPKAGQNAIRILPPIPPDKLFFHSYYMVFKFGPNQRSFVPRKQFGDENCPWEAYYTQLKQQKDEVSRKMVQQFRPSLQIAMWIVDRSDQARGPQLWSTTRQNLNTISSFMADPQVGDMTLANPDADGRGACDLVVHFTPKEMTDNGIAKYQMYPARQSSPLGNLDWLKENLFEKHNVGRASDPEWIKAILEGRDREFIEQLRAGSVSEEAAPWEDDRNSKALCLPAGITLATEFWLAQDGKVSKTTADAIGKLLEIGQNPQIMPLTAGAVWGTAASLGFSITPVTVTPPPSPPSAPAPSAAPATPPPPPLLDPAAMQQQLQKMQQMPKPSLPTTADELEKMLREAGAK
jgi:hypothetical protein